MNPDWYEDDEDEDWYDEEYVYPQDFMDEDPDDMDSYNEWKAHLDAMNPIHRWLYEAGLEIQILWARFNRWYGTEYHLPSAEEIPF